MLTNDQLIEAYSAHVKACVRSGTKPPTPDEYVASHGGGGGNPPKAPRTKFGGGDDESKRREHAARIRAAFYELLWISGYSKKMSVMERGLHYGKLGEATRANHVRPSAPCTVCSDLFCDWSN